MRVAAHLQRPTRELVWAHSTLPYSVLLRVGFTLPHALPHARCALTAPFHTYRTCARRYIFCGTFRRLAPPRRYLAPCPMEPGLSSRNEFPATAWPTPCRQLNDSRRNGKFHHVLFVRLHQPVDVVACRARDLRGQRSRFPRRQLATEQIEDAPHVG